MKMKKKAGLHAFVNCGERPRTLVVVEKERTHLIASVPAKTDARSEDVATSLLVYRVGVH